MGKNKDNPNKIGAVKFLTWSFSGAPVAIQAVLIGFFSIYCTSALQMNPALVGTILFATKVFDGFTDLIAGYVVDRTNTRWGKGRPYEWAIVGIWLMTWLLFSVPTQFSTVAKSIWIFVCYSLAQSVFLTLKNAAANVYMVRAFNNTQKYIKLNSIGGFLSMILIVVFNVIFPRFYAKVLTDAPGWSRLIFYITVPMIIIGMLRFFFVKEVYNVDVESNEKVTLKDVFTVLKNNKNVYLVALLFGAINIAAGLNVGSYYFAFVVGNIELSGTLSTLGFVTMLFMLTFPLFLKKMTTAQFIRRSLMISIVSGLILFMAKGNILMLAIGGLLGGIVSLPTSYLGNILIVECADYNEWMGMQRMEGTLSSVTNFAMKIGQAFGVLLTGWLLSAAGFDSTATTQSGSAIFMIRLLYSLIPTAIYLIAACGLFFYKLDKMKPQMDKDLEERRAAAEQA